MQAKRTLGFVGLRAAAATAASVPVTELSDAERAAYAAEIGFNHIGKELPDGVQLSDVVQSMPKEVSNSKALTWKLINLPSRVTHWQT